MLLAALVASALGASGQPAEAINISFQKSAAHRDALLPGNPPSAPGEIVVPSRAYWNSLAAETDGKPVAMPLAWADGTASPVTLGAQYGYSHESNAGSAPANLADKDAVMFDAWVGIRGTESISISGIPASLAVGYKVVLFGDSNQGNRMMEYTLAGRTQAINDTGTYDGDPGPFMIVWRDLSGGSFTISGNDASLPRSAINGLRILPNDVPAMPPSVAFRADDHYVGPGATVTLSWTAEDADAIAIDGGIGDVTALTVGGTGSLPYTVEGNVVLTLAATNALGSRSASIELRTGPPRPNLVVVLIDDMGMMDSSEPFAWDGGGNPLLHPTMPYRTPQMERMAGMGAKFATTYAMSVCSPTRTSLMTGLNSVRHGMTDWSSGQIDKKNDNPVLDPPPDWLYRGVLGNHVLLTDLLAGNGYRNLMVGKTHWGNTGNNPLDVGFHRAVGYGTGSDKLDYFDKPGLAKYAGTGSYVTKALTLEANALIEEAVSDGVPFFAYVSHFAVHSPFQLDPRFAANYPTLSGSALNFATMVEGIDKSLGDVLDRLEALGVGEETLVVFLGDNGSDAPIGENNSWPLRGKKGTEWEGGSRVPLLVAWAKPDPDNPFQQAFPVRERAVVHDIVAVHDLFPTLLEAAGIPEFHGIDGHSLAPYLAGTPGSHRPQEHLLHYPHDHRGNYYGSLRQGDWKLVFRYEAFSHELYNLAEDAGETIDRMAGEPERTMAMARRMAMLLNESGALWPVAESDGSRHPFLMPWLPEVDTDGDGIPDNFEDPNRNGLVDPGETDPDNPDTDGDGIPDGAELRLGLDPLDPDSVFAMDAEHGSPNHFILTWPSLPDNRFTVLAASNLVHWEALAPNLPAGPGTSTSFNAGPPGNAPRFFRVELRTPAP